MPCIGFELIRIEFKKNILCKYLKNTIQIHCTTGYFPDLLRTSFGPWSKKFERGPTKIRQKYEFDYNENINKTKDFQASQPLH